MKKLSLLFLIAFGFSVNPTFAEWIDLGNGFYYESITKDGEYINYKYKISDLTYINNILNQTKDASKISPIDVSYVISNTSYNCSDYSTKILSMEFYNRSNKRIYTHKDDQWRKMDENNEETVKYLCKNIDILQQK